jgi:hypothetical protein
MQLPRWRVFRFTFACETKKQHGYPDEFAAATITGCKELDPRLCSET